MRLADNFEVEAFFVCFNVNTLFVMITKAIYKDEIGVDFYLTVCPKHETYVIVRVLGLVIFGNPAILEERLLCFDFLFLHIDSKSRQNELPFEIFGF